MDRNNVDFKSLLIAGTKICQQNKGFDLQTNAQLAFNELISSDSFDINKVRSDPNFKNAMKLLDNMKQTSNGGIIETNTVIEVNDNFMKASIGGHNFDIDLTLS